MQIIEGELTSWGAYLNLVHGCPSISICTYFPTKKFRLGFLGILAGWFNVLLACKRVHDGDITLGVEIKSFASAFLNLLVPDGMFLEYKQKFRVDERSEAMKGETHPVQKSHF